MAARNQRPDRSPILQNPLCAPRLSRDRRSGRFVQRLKGKTDESLNSRGEADLASFSC